MAKLARLVALLAVFLAAAFSGSAASAPLHRNAGLKTCPDKDVLANLSWGQKCLGVGEFCKVGNVEYHAYGFDCPASGHLTDYNGSASPGSTTTTAPTTTSSAPATATYQPPAKVTVRCPLIAPITRSVAAGVKTKPKPANAKQAVALVVASSDVNDEATPFQCVSKWAAEWMGQAWWVVGQFESPWGVPFLVDASVTDGQVYASVGAAPGYAPSLAWMTKKAHAWGMHSLFTRLTPADAIKFVEYDGFSLSPGTVIRAAAAKLILDNSSIDVGWVFAFYVQDPSGTRSVVAVTGLGGTPAKEGAYVGNEYGFGSEAEAQPNVPLSLLAWVHSVEGARGWKPS